MREKPLILMVDDEQDFLDIFSTKLSASGFETAIAHGPQEALAIIPQLRPDLVLMDIQMPGGTGTDTALTLKQNPATRNIKIAFLSSMKDPWPRTIASREDLAKELGMEDFIDKGSDLDAVTAKVRAILGL
jgi:CheY-like chemotaxis protein